MLRPESWMMAEPIAAAGLAGLAALSATLWRWARLDGGQRRLRALWEPRRTGEALPRRARRALVAAALRVLDSEALRCRLDHAGGPHGWRPEDLALAKIAAAGLGLALLPLCLGRTDAAAFLGGACLGWFAPDAWLSARAEARAQRMREEAFLLADLLASVAAAGVASLHACLGRVTEHAHGPLGREFRRALDEAAGGKPLAEALADVAARSGAEEVRRLCTVLAQTQEYGGPMAALLRAEARQMWKLRLQKARERAGAIQPRLTLILVVFMLFPLVAVVFGPYWPQLKAGFGAM